MGSITFTLNPLPPFRLDLTVWVLRRRPDNLLDRWDGSTYKRVLVLRNVATLAAVRQSGSTVSPQLHVTLSASPLTAEMTREATATLELMLGLQSDLSGFYKLAAHDAKLGALAERFQGVKPPRFPTIFEGFVNAIACQQLTLTFGIQLINRLVGAFGLPLTSKEGAPHGFPRPEDVAGLEPEAFRALGFSRRKGETMIGLARTMLDGGLRVEELEALDDVSALRSLCALKGIGRWSAEYLLLRTLGRTNVFPGDDVGGQRNLQRWLQLPDPLDYDGIWQHLIRWQPYGGLIYFQLLLDRLNEAGQLS
ncbi:DNA-3-methyladenine glycosylase family protein [Geobacter grbiciae]|uniref:DNA-3-methyladenine glycosylase family protein n=1 Tax=Geobacter grbiciae TaxID=155042 RepID=UPI001C032AA1|nr:hypothetical protein [Geobacter grbiciae]MBT1074431.1 hypothetical protein [Geobacter grbiciae]